MAVVHHISNYKATFTDKFFIDNNVWMFLFCPIGNYEKKKQEQYSSFVEVLINKQSTIFINALVLSEFCNAYLRADFTFWSKEPINSGKINYKKDFVGTDHFKKTVEEIKVSINKILSFSIKASDDFNAINLTNVFDNFGISDFNDSYYVELGRMKNYKIITDDADLFVNNKLGIEIITANIKK